MPQFIRAYDNHNNPVVNVQHPVLPRTYFNIVRLHKGETYYTAVPGYETCWVLWQGKANIEVNGELFNNVGNRENVWENHRADSVYAPTGAQVRVTAVSDEVAIGVAGGRCDTAYKAFRVAPEEVQPVDVGSPETHSRRVIHHILGAKDKGRTGNILVSELYADPGCWAGYPPHKHGDDIPSSPDAWEETGFEEIYHFRYNPENGFGAQFCYTPDDQGGDGVCRMRSGDTYLINGGYHPGVTSPGHAAYIFTILIGHTQHSLVQNFEPQYRHLCASLPGVQSMVDLFTGNTK